MATVAKLKEDLAKAREEIARLTAEVEAKYQEAEVYTDSLLDNIKNSRLTALIVGGAVGVAVSFYLITC